MRVDGRGGMEPDGLADLADCGRIAVLAQVSADEVEDLLLALREVLDEVHLPSSVSRTIGGGRCDGRTHVRESSAPRGRFQAAFWAERSAPTIIDAPQAAVAELV